MKGIIITMLLISAFLGGHLQAEDLKWDLPFLVKMNDKILEQQTKEWKNVPLSQIQKAAVQGDVNAQFILGLKYNNSVGYGNRAQDWLNKAAEQYSIIAKQGNARAQFILGWMYENRLIFAANGVEQGLQTEAWYLKASEQGYADALFKLGFIYSQKDYEDEHEQAAVWFSKAAEQYRKYAAQGDADSELKLALMYTGGLGVAQDFGQAVTLYRKQADQGLADGQNRLGVMYLKGLGVKQDAIQAIALFHKAAEQGHAEAQRNLGFIYLGELDDYGVQRDYKLAYTWLLVAEANGGGNGEVSTIREGLERSLPPDVLDAGAELAKEYHEKYQPMQ
ncbi:tetratricopeptide repeat protein [Aeromonas caviae]|uniref:tetratricopeptide repeat protein n=1 Tax=Aeromonas caviae TaxID=648 RepID=UPI00244AB292|nr:tetratricopeptide repeat protein [Aeromonas caviae]MDH1839384.1 sel1 repeat family protein [Aeromonas caviae]MDX7693943.1 tetratricopeptide repeat protein [Aeromonas caviae]